jgi:hypothetical protein
MTLRVVFRRAARHEFQEAARVKRFPYSVFFLPEASRIVVLAIFHDSTRAAIRLCGKRASNSDRRPPARVASRVATPQPQSLNRRRVKRLRAVPRSRCRTSNSVFGCRRLSRVVLEKWAKIQQSSVLLTSY